jgi:hypothetical protein
MDVLDLILHLLAQLLPSLLRRHLAQR